MKLSVSEERRCKKAVKCFIRKISQGIKNGIIGPTGILVYDTFNTFFRAVFYIVYSFKFQTFI